MIDPNIIREIDHIVNEPVETRAYSQVWKRVSTMPIPEALDLLQFQLDTKKGITAEIRAIRQVITDLQGYVAKKE